MVVLALVVGWCKSGVLVTRGGRPRMAGTRMSAAHRYTLTNQLCGLTWPCPCSHQPGYNSPATTRRTLIQTFIGININNFNLHGLKIQAAAGLYKG